MAPKIDHINDRALQIGKALFDQIHKTRDSVTSMNKWTREMIEWCMSNPDVKGRVLRFVDVLPTLKTSRAVTEHIRAYFSPSESRLPMALRSGSAITHTPFTARAVSKITQHITTDIAKQFICGETVKEALDNLQILEGKGMSYSLDILGEAVTSDKQADAYQNSVINLINELPSEKNISIKLSALTPHFDPLPYDHTVQDVLKRLIPIIQKAQEKNTFVTIDAEQYHVRDLTLDIAKRILLEPRFKDNPHIGLVFQAYLKDTETVLTEFIEFLKKHNRAVGIRLVKGAYWDSEVANAKAQGWPIPVFTEKEHTDAAFEKCTSILFENRNLIKVAIGSHNVRSIAHAIALDEESNDSKDSLEFQLLYGMADPLKKALVERGHHVRVYSPFGPLLPGMAYLVRRIMENTSNESFLRMDFTHEVDEMDLLKMPTIPNVSTNGHHNGKHPSLENFHNEPLIDFSKKENREKFQSAIEEVSQERDGKVRLTIDGNKIDTTHYSPSLNPSQPNHIIGSVSKADWRNAEHALEVAKRGFSVWKNVSVHERADCLFRAAQIMRDLRMELAAWEVCEAGKTWSEADADVAEAIDFLEYYGRAAIHISENSTLATVPGEKNEYKMNGRGVVAVIAPWNFPLAILTGMTSAALVTGNAAIVKPAETTRVLGSLLVDILLEAGIPSSVISFLPGSGAEIGKGLVNSPDIDMVAFTGSKEVGLSIIQNASMTSSNQKNIRKVVAEMGGKNAIIVDSDADFDEAIPGVIQSAFGYQGQKCSACSRLILMNDIYDEFLDRLIEATKTLKTGNPQNPQNDLGPVIDLDSHKRINDIIEEGRREARMVFQGEIDPGMKDGYFIPPTIFTESPINGTLAHKEIFGPVLTVFRAASFEKAIRIANHTEFGLTAGLYSRNPIHIKMAKDRLDVGNIYINRKITGAMVARQPFGGHHMSGTGPKAGGLEYLFHFMHPKTISENTLRHGFPL